MSLSLRIALCVNVCAGPVSYQSCGVCLSLPVELSRSGPDCKALCMLPFSPCTHHSVVKLTSLPRPLHSEPALVSMSVTHQAVKLLHVCSLVSATSVCRAHKGYLDLGVCSLAQMMHLRLVEPDMQSLLADCICTIGLKRKQLTTVPPFLIRLPYLYWFGFLCCPTSKLNPKNPKQSTLHTFVSQRH